MSQEEAHAAINHSDSSVYCSLGWHSKGFFTTIKTPVFFGVEIAAMLILKKGYANQQGSKAEIGTTVSLLAPPAVIKRGQLKNEADSTSDLSIININFSRDLCTHAALLFVQTLYKSAEEDEMRNETKVT